MTSTKTFATSNLMQLLLDCVGAYFHTYESDTSFTTTTTTTITTTSSTSTSSTSFGPPSKDTDSPVPVELWHRNTRGRTTMDAVYCSNDCSDMVWVENLKPWGLVLIPFSGMILLIWCIKHKKHSEQPRSYMYEGDTVANTTYCEDPNANASNHHRGSSRNCSRHGTNLNLNSNSSSNAFEYLEENEDSETDMDTEPECYCDCDCDRDLECKGNCKTTRRRREGEDSPVVVVAIPTTIQPIATKTRTRTRTNARIVPSSGSSDDDKNENVDEESGMIVAEAAAAAAMGVGGPDRTEKTLSTTAEADSLEGSDSHTE